LPLAVAAAGLPLFVWSALGDEIAMPRLAASFWLTGCSLVALSWAGAWAQVRWRAVAWPGALLGAVLVTSAIATAIGTDPLRSLLGEYQRYQGLLPLLMYGALGVAAMAATAYAGSPRPLLWGAFVGGALSAAYGLIQWAGWDWVTWAGVPSGQIGGAFAQPEVLGIELVVAAAASTGLLQDAGQRARAAVIAGIALMLFVVLLALSRGAWVGAVAGAGVLAVLHADLLRSWRSRWWYAVPVAAVLAAAVLVLPQGRDTLGSAWRRVGSARNFTDTSVSQRVGLWDLSLQMAADHPIVGAGPDAFPQLFPAYRTQDQPGYHTQNVRPESSHDILLDRLVDTGAIGLLALLAFLGACAWAGLRAWRRATGAPRAEMAALLAAAAAYYAATLFFFAESATGWMPWLLLGAIVGVASISDDDDGDEGVSWSGMPVVRGVATAFGVVLVLGGLILVLADYQSGRALAAAQRGDVVAAEDHIHSATRWNPLEPQYLLALGSYRAGYAASGHPEQWASALSTFHRLNTWFEPTAVSLVREAEAQANVAFTTQQDKERVFDLLERAVRADPNNAGVRQGVVDFYVSVQEDSRAAPHQAWLAQARAKGDAPPE
jgi:O-antigen ligase